MITLNNVHYRYDNLDMHFQLEVNRGERVAVLGPSGAGKSTLLNLIAGFILADEGEIWLNHADHTRTTPDKRPVSMLFQENNLFAHLTVEQNIGLGFDPGLRLSEQQRASLDEIMAQSGLTEFRQRRPAQLSGGQRQRVALSRCLVREQPILLLDEPFSALDPALRKEMLALVAAMTSERGLTLLMVTHNIEDALAITDKTIIIEEGTIAYEGASDQLTSDHSTALKIMGMM